MGYQVACGVFSASEVGAPHIRERLFILARREEDEVLGDSDVEGLEIRLGEARHDVQELQAAERAGYDVLAGDAGFPLWPPLPTDFQAWDDIRADLKPLIPRTSDGLADRVERIRATGNGQVPAVVRLAWETLI
jgi:DNA (cytosine-5)-methyltransferase 1